jgi:hypothetical protein
MSPSHEHFLKIVLNSGAVEKCKDNRKRDLTFADACRFWSIPEHMKGGTVDKRIEEIDNTLSELDMLLADINAEMSDGRTVTSLDIFLMTYVHRYLKDRFERHLRLLRDRGWK